jgi:LysM repeat protein
LFQARIRFGSPRSGGRISALRPVPLRNLVAIVLVLWGCAGVCVADDGAVYRVRRGDNLTLIAHRMGITLDELRKDNGLSRDVIHPDQLLRIRRPFHGLRAEQIRWRCPLGQPGSTLRPFGRYRNAQGALIPHTGVDLAASRSYEVVSPATGVIRYLGEQDGFGMLVIVDHGAGYASVLAPLDPESVTVEVGEVVLGGTPLARVGPPVEHDRPYLHVELRRQNKAVDPSRLKR